MVLAVGERPVRKLTVDEVMRMVEAGVPDDIGRLELLHGVLVEKVSEGGTHGGIKERLVAWLGAAASTRRFRLRVESSLLVADPTSLPEPDIAIVAPGDELEMPDNALLAIEISVSSLRTDLAVKAELYAAAAVSEYWVIDVHAREIVVHSEPRPQGYGHIRRVGAGCLEPREFEHVALDVGALFAGLS